MNSISSLNDSISYMFVKSVVVNSSMCALLDQLIVIVLSAEYRHIIIKETRVNNRPKNLNSTNSYTDWHKLILTANPVAR